MGWISLIIRSPSVYAINPECKLGHTATSMSGHLAHRLETYTSTKSYVKLNRDIC